MKIDFTGRGFEITPSIRSHTQAKLERLLKHLDGIQDVTVVFSVEKYRQKCEINFLSSKHSFHGAEETDDMLASIDGVIEKLEKQARKLKTKRVTSKRKGQETIRVNGETALTGSSEPEIRIIHTKPNEIKPMTVEEAVEQLQKSSHEFLVFQNSESDRLGVVFKRKDGHYGFVEDRA
ncbi:MAG: ribosome-associated translation inhibitor RaiA [Acidobacteria bacterium]|nr:ribosome-associated translation inhibitor RaiA [Acidobacteriota bacterium]MCB9396822.1 ribosome-associated translation inhibitor RaiA [Acidobacteriota bacterium]